MQLLRRWQYQLLKWMASVAVDTPRTRPGELRQHLESRGAVMEGIPVAGFSRMLLLHCHSMTDHSGWTPPEYLETWTGRPGQPPVMAG